MTAELARTVFGLLFETSYEGLFLIDRASGRIVSANVRVAELLARDVDSVVNATLDDLLFEHERDLTQAGQYEELALRRADGYPIFVTLVIALVDDPQRGAFAACTVRDTTERRELERELVAKHSALVAAHADLEAAHAQLVLTKQELEDRNREIALLAWRAAVGELVAGIAHHLNNPVGALASTVRFMHGAIAKVSPDAREPLLRLTARVAKIAQRIESNVDAIVKASHSATAGASRLELPHELSNVLASFSDSLDDIPTKEPS